MHSLRPLHSLLQAVIGTIVLAVLVRTWLVMGLVAPVTVAGSSMAPTLRGEHLQIICPQCEAEFDQGAEFSTRLAAAKCPQCGKTGISLERSIIYPGNPLTVDRFSINWRSLQRGELVVLRNPSDARQLCVKRVWGLPGETVELRRGDVLVDGVPLNMPFELQRTMRQLVHRAQEHAQRWAADDEVSWYWQQESWQVEKHDSPITHWLRYRQPGGEAITDDVPYNADLTRRLNLVRDVMLSAEVWLAGSGMLELIVDDGAQVCRMELNMSDGDVTALIGNRNTVSGSIPRELLERSQNRWTTIELSNFDRCLLLAIDSHVVLKADLAADLPQAGTATPFAIGVRQLVARVRRLEVFRDVYFTSQAVGLPPRPGGPIIQLGPGEYFLLGDNCPVSVDSRTWGAVPKRLFVGRPLGVR